MASCLNRGAQKGKKGNHGREIDSGTHKVLRAGERGLSDKYLSTVLKNLKGSLARLQLRLVACMSLTGNSFSHMGVDTVRLIV
jgi:hypothetical protein